MKYPRKPFLFDCFSPDCGAALVPAVAEALSAGLGADQMNVLGTFLTAVADTISYMASQKEFNESTCPKAPTEERRSGSEEEFLPDEEEEEPGRNPGQEEEPEKDSGKTNSNRNTSRK